MKAVPAREAVAYPDAWRSVDLGVPSEHLREEHLRRAAALMAERGIGGLVVLAAGSFGERAMVRFVANHITTGRQSAAVLSADGRLVLFVVYSAHFAWAVQSSWADEIRLVPRLEEAIFEHLRTVVPAGPTGVAGPSLAVSSFTATARMLAPSRQIVDVSSDALDLQVRKSALDLWLSRRSGELARNALAGAIRTLTPGMTERDLFADLECELRRQGAETTSILVSSDGSVASGIARGRAIREGDLVQLSVEVAGPGGYWVQAVRTVALGKSDGPSNTALAAAGEAERLLVDQLRPGSDLRSAVLPEGLLPPNLEPAVPFWHGIGLSLGEPPSQDGDGGRVLEKGMVIVVHPNLYGKDLGVFLGNTYVIEDSGAESITGGNQERATEMP
ncbi:MAG: M24 family metallopeptidase [Candidatus Limnocylindrales bacterium]